jgi:hypothetical protein
MINIKAEKPASLSRARPLKVVESNCVCACHERICGGGDKALFTLNHGATRSWVLSFAPAPVVTRKNSVAPA